MVERAEINRALLRLIDLGEQSPVAKVASTYGLARQTVSKYLSRLVEEGHISMHGRGKGIEYNIVEMRHSAQFNLKSGLSEDIVWEQAAKAHAQDLSNDDYDICQFGFTEMVNNAIDHSEGTRLDVAVTRSPVKIAFAIRDNGVGIFQKLTKALKLTDVRQSLLELSKGKFTTDPDRHTGEVIFFTSRVFDYFSIQSNDLGLVHRETHDDWFLESRRKERGTIVVMQLLLGSGRTLKEVFDRFSSGPDEHIFAKTHLPLRLSSYGRDGLVSRSQAKRVLSRVDRFYEVTLDFAGVEQIGQGFADEIFRVFRRQNPTIEIRYLNANENVEKMIRRARAVK